MSFEHPKDFKSKSYCLVQRVDLLVSSIIYNLRNVRMGARNSIKP